MKIFEPSLVETFNAYKLLSCLLIDSILNADLTVFCILFKNNAFQKYSQVKTEISYNLIKNLKESIINIYIIYYYKSIALMPLK